MIHLDIKPLSVNEAFRGRRFKTEAYKRYSFAVSLMLPKMVVPEGLLKVYYEFGMSNPGSDLDNPVKNFTDILQAKYGFNDNRIMEAHIVKTVVPKGKEFIKFKIEAI